MVYTRYFERSVYHNFSLFNTAIWQAMSQIFFYVLACFNMTFFRHCWYHMQIWWNITYWNQLPVFYSDIFLSPFQLPKNYNAAGHIEWMFHLIPVYIVKCDTSHIPIFCISFPHNGLAFLFVEQLCRKVFWYNN